MADSAHASRRPPAPQPPPQQSSPPASAPVSASASLALSDADRRQRRVMRSSVVIPASHHSARVAVSAAQNTRVSLHSATHSAHQAQASLGGRRSGTEGTMPLVSDTMPSRFRPSQMVLDLRASSSHTSFGSLKSRSQTESQSVSSGKSDFRSAASKALATPMSGGMSRFQSNARPILSASNGSENASTRWISGIRVKDAVTQTNGEFVPYEYQYVNWEFVHQTPKSSDVVLGFDLNDDAISEQLSAMELGSETYQPQKASQSSTVILTPHSNISPLTKVSIESPTPAQPRCSGPNADQLLESIVEKLTTDEDAPHVSLLDDKMAVNPHTPISPPTDTWIARPRALRYNTDGGIGRSDCVESTRDSKVDLSCKGHRDLLSQHENIKRYYAASTTSSESSSISFAGGYSHCVASQLYRQNLQQKNNETKYQPSTPISQNYSNSAQSEDENSSVASSYLTFVGAGGGTGSPDSSKLFNLGRDGGGAMSAFSSAGRFGG
ncbi:hypothetical protein HDU83_004797 [Entophlyctis luteolus]|nr:hypothetical protein HDU83_004797 [Entophlyctis luteolus]